MKLRLLALLLLSLPALAAPAADWSLVRKNDAVSLSLDRKSLERKGDLVKFSYRIDFARPQGDPATGVMYRSLVIHASMLCAKRSFSMGETDLFEKPGGQGVNLGQSLPSEQESTFKPIEKGSSDEDLWKALCTKKK